MEAATGDQAPPYGAGRVYFCAPTALPEAVVAPDAAAYNPSRVMLAPEAPTKLIVKIGTISSGSRLRN